MLPGALLLMYVFNWYLVFNLLEKVTLGHYHYM
jgi:hypothetical protein